MRLFGTNGIREVVGGTLDARFVTDIVGAIAEVHEGKGTAIVGTDARTSSPALGRIAAGTLAMAGMDVLELGILPTPAIQYNVPRLHASFAVVITASHNPPEFNGIKGIAADGLEFPRELEERVEAAYAARRGRTVDFARVGTITPVPDGASRYVDGILSCVNVDRIRQRKLRVLVDCGNGTSTVSSPLLLQKLGVRYVALNATFDGTFPGHLSEPTEANVAGTVRTVTAVGADFGVVHDGDADRSVFIDEKGRYIPGEKMLALFAREAVRAHPGGLVVTPVTSSDAVAEVIAPFGGSVLFTRVGSPVVARAMQEHKAVMGGEENGGLIFADHQLARDGAVTLAKVSEILATTGQPLSELIDSLPPYHLVKEKVACPVPLRAKLLDAVPGLLDADSGGEVTRIDGVKVRTSKGWVLVRPSGTEPLCRIFAESRDRAVAEELARGTARRVASLVEDLERESLARA